LGPLYRDLRTSQDGLSGREAARPVVSAPNELSRRSGRRWPRELLRQLTHPLALLLTVAGAVAWLAGTGVLTAAIAAYLPRRAWVPRDSHRVQIDARELVPGDVVLVEEGDRICADARLIAGDVRPVNGTIHSDRDAEITCTTS
jgi:magnesium-transporting ATPase (P-type)